MKATTVSSIPRASGVPAIAASLGAAAVLIAQTGLLWLVNALGRQIFVVLHLPLPGNVGGLVLMFLLLLAGVIPPQWVEAAASLLLRHLGMFFLPVAVGFMDFGQLVVTQGLTIGVCLLGSAAIGFAVSGRVCQMVAARLAAATAASDASRHGADLDAP